MFRRFSVIIFGVASLIYLFIFLYSYLLAYAIDEGNILPRWQHIVASFFIVLQYPGFLIRRDDLTPALLIFIIALNCAFYGLLAERFSFYLFRARIARIKKANVN
jgi:hypothetical protein